MEDYFFPLYFGAPTLLAVYNVVASRAASDEQKKRLRKRARSWLLFQLLWVFLGPVLLMIAFPPHVN